MALFPALDTDFADLDAQSALRLPLGAASPLWFAFASAASAGVAYWWMTRWSQFTHLEAFDGFALKTLEAPTPTAVVPAIVAEPALEAPVQAAMEPIEAATDAIVETVAELAQPAEPVTSTVEDTADVAIAAADDLTRLVGVGPRLAERLGELGVNSFKDIAAWTEEDLASFDKALDLKGRAVRDAWVAQARRFAEA